MHRVNNQFYKSKFYRLYTNVLSWVHCIMNHVPWVIVTITVFTLDRIYLSDIFGISNGTISILIGSCQGILDIRNDIWNDFLSKTTNSFVIIFSRYIIEDWLTVQGNRRSHNCINIIDDCSDVDKSVICLAESYLNLGMKSQFEVIWIFLGDKKSSKFRYSKYFKIISQKDVENLPLNSANYCDQKW